MSETRFEMKDFLPADTPEYMIPAWASALHWAIGEPGILEAFKQSTGLAYKAPRSPLDAMIDDATGVRMHFIKAFIPWFNENVWGKIDAPPEGE